MQFTIQTITDTAIDLADMKYSQFIDQSGTAGTELIRYANLAYRDLYNQIIMSHEHYFTIPYTFSTVNGTDTYALPNDFYKLDGVDMALDSSGRYISLRPFVFAERNKYRSGIALTTSIYGQVYRYLLVQNNIKLIPIPSLSINIQMWYTPEPTVITSLSGTITVPPGCDEYMSLYIAALMKVKEQQDATDLNYKRVEVLKQLQNTLKGRDDGAPTYITDESTLNIGALYPFRGFE